LHRLGKIHTAPLARWRRKREAKKGTLHVCSAQDLRDLLCQAK
jgi:hypothetical protein